MADNFLTKHFFEFVIAKHIPMESLEEDAPYFMGEDSFNSDTAEAALNLAYDLYPEKPGEDESDTMEKRHEFVSEFLEHARCEVVKKWASNLGMLTKEEADAKANAQAAFAVQKFKNMSAYQFSAWKLGVPANDKDNEKIMESVEDDIFYDAKYGNEFDPCDLDITIDNSSRVPQDSEDEAWEQMMAIRERKFDV